MRATRGVVLVEPAECESEHALWQRVGTGDHAAFTDLFHRHFEAVWAQGYRLTGSRSTAEDLAATTFLTAWHRAGDVRLVRDSARPWLLAVVTNLARTEWRSRDRHQRAVARLGPPAVTADHADTVVGQDAEAAEVRRVLAAVDALPPALREAVGLCLIGEMPTADAARALGVTEVSVRSRISRARRRLRALLKEES